MLLTEATENAATKTLTETWGSNERMPHLPSLEHVIAMLDHTLRTRIEVLFASFSAMPADDARRPAIEEQIRCVCRGVDRLADCARHTRSNVAPAALIDRLHAAIQHCVSNLRSLDPNLFGRRYPVQTHERSKAEPIVSSLNALTCQVEKLAKLVREVDAEVDERLLAGLVVLEQPLRREAMA